MKVSIQKFSKKFSSLNSQFSSDKGFTLIELLVVIGILAVLLAITLIAINPARQFGNANNTKRRSDVTQILNGIGAYGAENKGQLPPEIAALAVSPPAAPTALNATNFPQLCGQLISNFMPAFPTNPTLNLNDITAADCAVNPPVWQTGYSISRDATNRVTVSADTADNGAVISVTR